MEIIEPKKAKHSRPKRVRNVTVIPEDELLKLVNLNYSGADIAEYFGCYKEKIYKMLKQMEVSANGYKKVGVKIDRNTKQRPYVRNSLCRSEYLTKPVLELDSKENVRASLSLTHFGLYDKFSRWAFFVHGGIDVYSRYILYMEVSVTNDAPTVLSCFRQGVEEKGLPVAVRCDISEEIEGVVHFMDLNRPDVKDRIQHQNAGANSRFRRVWCDVLRFCLQPYRTTFKDMEKNGQLDSKNPVDIYCLHQCYMHLIKDAVAKFTQKWNQHQISTAGQMTPVQLHMVGLHNIQRRAGLEGLEFPELDERKIIEVDPNHEWSPTSHPSSYRRVLKKKKDRAELRLKFPQELITFQSAPDIYQKMRRKVHKILNSST